MASTLPALFLGFVYAQGAQFCYEINANNINLRADATATSPVLSLLDKGEKVEVISEQYDWYKIRLPKSLPVYIKKNLAACIKYTEIQAVLPTDSVIRRCVSAKVLGDRVNIRAKPSEAAPIVGITDKNEIINVISDSAGWYKIEPIQNSFGWVHKKFVNKIPVLPIPQDTPEPKAKTSAPEIPEGCVALTGTVMPYGIVFMRQATHKLVTEDNKIFLLKGNRASLNALNRQKVKVIGKISGPANAKYPVVEIKAIEVAS